jgi:hypothetical protein
MNTLTQPEADQPAATPPPVPSEAGILAREMATVYRDLLEYYRDQYKLSPPEALAKADSPFCPQHADNLLRGPADQVTWHGLSHLAEHQPELAEQCWERVKQAARDELHTGHRAAKAMEGYHSDPWRRARFLAVREDLARAWRPRNGMELQLIDTMAQAQTAMFFWQERLTDYMLYEAQTQRRDVQEFGKWNPPRISDADAIEQAAAMVDRFNRIYLRTLRALRDLRRYTPAVIVQNAGQVNVGGQQVNVTSGGS